MPTPHDPLLQSLRRPTVLAGIVIGTQALAVVLALGPPSGDRWTLLGLWSLLLQWVALGTTGLVYAARGLLSRLRPIAIGACALAMLGAVGGLVGWAASGVVEPETAASDGLGWRLGGIVLAVGAIGMITLLNHWRARQLATQVKQAELDALRARVRPHFLFNTLNTAASLVRLRPSAAEAALLDLADLFRAALASEAQVTLAEELTFCRQYLAIEELRFGDRLRVSWTLPNPLPDASLPPLSIQPLLENAVHHGVEGANGPSLLEVTVTADERFVRVIVTNPVSAQSAGHRGHGIGVDATRRRLEGVSGGTLITARRGQLFEAILTLPRESHRLPRPS